MRQRRYVEFRFRRLSGLLVILFVRMSIAVDLCHLHRRKLAAYGCTTLAFLYYVVVHHLLRAGVHRIRHPGILVFAIQRRNVVVRQFGVFLGLQLAVVQAAVSADLHFAFDVHAERIGEFERVEEGVGYHGGPFVGAFCFQKTADHFRSQHAAVLVGELDDVTRSVRRHA